MVMLKVLKFLFSDFWYFLGALVLMVYFLDGVADIIRAFRK